MLIHSDPDLSDAAPGFAGIPWKLWTLLVLALVFFAVARLYVRHEEQRWAVALNPTPGPSFTTETPAGAVRAEHLRLGWDEVEGAARYRLHIETVTGRIIVDGLIVESVEWFPPFDALPGFESGEYRWSVDALDLDGRVLARSAKESFRVY